MVYDFSKMSMSALIRPAFDAGVALARLDERIARSPVGAGLLERTHFADACASLWIDGELVHLEDLLLHDATKDIRTPPTNSPLPATCSKPAGASPHCRPAGRSAPKASAASADRFRLRRPPTSLPPEV